MFLKSSLGVSVLGEEKLYDAVVHSRKDGVGSGYCGRGVFSVLSALGFDGLRSANGGDWEEVLQAGGWRPLYCPWPALAPFGSVLVYLSDLELRGYNFRGTKGGRYGHVEMVSKTPSGKRVYVSDAVRDNPGGTVPCNFTKRAWIPPNARVENLGVYRWGFAWYDPQALQEESLRVKEFRLGLARRYFSQLGYMKK